MVQWHKLLGLILRHLFSGSRYKVEIELSLTTGQYFLDILVVEEEEGKAPEVIPDGLEKMSKYNLISYKSIHESLS